MIRSLLALLIGTSGPALAASTAVTLNPGDTLSITIGPVPLVESAQNTQVPPALAIVDAAGNVWTLTAAGTIAANGYVDPVTHNVDLIAYEQRVLWQHAGGLWYSWMNGNWSAGSTIDPRP